MPSKQPLYRREIELLSQGTSPSEISHLANLLKRAINPLVCGLSGGTLDLSAVSIPDETSLVPCAAFIFMGTLTSDQTVIVSNRAQWWYVQNAMVGAFTLKIRTPSGPLSSPILPNSAWQLIRCDGKNNILLSQPHIYQKATSSRRWFGPDQKQALNDIFRVACIPTDKICNELAFEVGRNVESAVLEQRIRNLKRKKRC